MSDAFVLRVVPVCGSSDAATGASNALWALGAGSQTALPVSVATNVPGRPVPVVEDPGYVVVVRHQT